MGNLVRPLLSGVASASPFDPSPSVIPFYCRIQKYTFLVGLSMMTKMSVLPQERCLRRLIAFGEERTLNTAITGKVAEERPFSPMQASASWGRVSGRYFP